MSDLHVPYFGGKHSKDKTHFFHPLPSHNYLDYCYKVHFYAAVKNCLELYTVPITTVPSTRAGTIFRHPEYLNMPRVHQY